MKKKIKLSIKRNKIGDYFIVSKVHHVTALGLEHTSVNKTFQCLSCKDAAEKFVLKSFQIKSFDKITIRSKSDFNQIIMQIEWVAMKLEEKEPEFCRHLLKYKVMANKYYEGEYVKAQ